ncbi:MAG: DUF4296 domain-containing protein [Mangrovibacterium sp.]
MITNKTKQPCVSVAERSRSISLPLGRVGGGFLLLFLVFTSCDNSKIEAPKNLPSATVMENVLYDIHYAEAIVQNHPDLGRQTTATAQHKNLISDSLYAGILQKYSIDDSLFTMSLLYYSAQPKNFEKIYDKVIERMTIDLNEQTYKDSLMQVLASEKQRRADSIAEAVRKHEADSIAEAIHRHFIDSIAEKTGRDYDFVVDSIAEAEAARIEFLVDSLLKIELPISEAMSDSIRTSMRQKLMEEISLKSKSDTIVAADETSRPL